MRAWRVCAVRVWGASVQMCMCVCACVRARQSGCASVHMHMGRHTSVRAAQCVMHCYTVAAHRHSCRLRNVHYVISCCNRSSVSPQRVFPRYSFQRPTSCMRHSESGQPALRLPHSPMHSQLPARCAPELRRPTGSSGAQRRMARAARGLCPA